MRKLTINNKVIFDHSKQTDNIQNKEILVEELMKPFKETLSDDKFNLEDNKDGHKEKSNIETNKDNIYQEEKDINKDDIGKLIAWDKTMLFIDLPELYSIPSSPDFELPKYGSKELIDYVLKLEIEKNELMYMRALENLPDTDIFYLMKNTNLELEQKNNEKIRHLAQCHVLNRLSKRICDNCGNKSNIMKLKLCNKCCISWYCSKECQMKHSAIHKLRCCNRSGPLDLGYQKILLISNK